MGGSQKLDKETGKPVGPVRKRCKYYTMAGKDKERVFKFKVDGKELMSKYLQDHTKFVDSKEEAKEIISQYRKKYYKPKPKAAPTPAPEPAPPAEHRRRHRHKHKVRVRKQN